MANKPDTKTVVVSIKTYERLLRRKMYPREPFNSVIDRILDGDIDEQKR